MAGESKTSVRRIVAVERARQALELRAAGVSYEQIANKLGYANRSGAEHAVKNALKRTLSTEATELRQVQMVRLDIALRSIWPNVLRGNIRAVLAFIKIAERVSKLNGLDAPIKAEVKETTEYIGMSDDERVEKINELMELARARRDAALAKAAAAKTEE